MNFTNTPKADCGVELDRAERECEGSHKAVILELENQHSDGWRNDREAATTVIGRKPGESCLLSLQDDRNSPAAAGQEMVCGNQTDS